MTSLGPSPRVHPARFRAERPLLDSTVHRSCYASTSDPARLSSSSEFLRVPPSRGFHRATAYQGSRPSSRHRRRASTYRGGSQASATFRPQAFSASRRFAPRSVSAGLFHPAATSRVDGPSRGFSPHAAPPSFRRARPPCRSTHRALTDRSRLPHPSASTSRLSSA
jgi:hypothetical protein